VEDVRTLTAHQRQQLQETEQVSPGVDRAPDVSQGNEPNACSPRGVPQRPRPVRRHRDLEAPGEHGQQRRDIRLRPSRFRKRHEKENARPPRHSQKRTTTVVGVRDLAAGALPVGVPGVGVFLWWAAAEGGYAPTTWYPGALLFLVLLLAVAAGPDRRTALQRPAKLAIALLTAFAIWSFLSIGWADVKGDAWDGANRTLLYASVFAAFALPRWRPGQVAGLLGLFAVGVAAIGAGVLAADGASAFIGNRLADPIGYANANAALFLAAFWPAVALAARPELHWVARSLLLASGGVVLQLAVLAQSRASFIAGSVALAIHLLLSPERLRALLALLPVAAVTLASLGPLLDVYASSTEAELVSAVARERRALAVSAVVLLVAGALLSPIGRRRLRRRPFGARGRLLAVTGAAAAALLITLAAGTTVMVHGSRLTGGLESGRYDVWRVAATELARNPVLGVGADNFGVDYVRQRRSDEELLYPHSVVLRAASQGGLVGAALFLGFLAAAFGAALGARRGHELFGQAVASAAVVGSAYWLLHGSVDWLWEFPALTAPALASLGLASGLAARSWEGPRRSRRPRRVPVAVLGAAAALAAVSYALPALAALQVERAVRAWPEEPDRVWSRLEQARQLNVFSERPDLITAVLARRGGQSARERPAFVRALERNPRDWYVHMRLALLAVDLGKQGDAVAHLRRARSLNPRGDVVDLAENAALAGRPVERQLLDTLDRHVIRSPLGRRPLTCRPVLGVGSRCPGGLG
jgi:O-Antigen ligase